MILSTPYNRYNEGTEICAIPFLWIDRRLKQVSLIRLALRLFSFRYTSVPSKILWKSCFGNCFFFPLIAESQLRKVREGKQAGYKIFPKQTFAQFFFLHKISVMRYQLLSGYFGLYPHSLSEKSGG